MEWLGAILGIVSLVGSIITSVQSNKKAKETDEYNKNLNQTIFDREDNAWQRAVEDRSKSGLSVAGLSQGAGAGGSVSQLQSQQSSAFQNLSNVLQNGAGTMFGLANSAYDRKLQKQIATDELQVKKQQLRHEKLTSRLQYMMDLAQIQLAAGKASDEHKIFAHNMKMATGEYTDPKYRVYGSEPSEIERILSALYNNVKNKGDSIFDPVNEVIPPSKEEVLTSNNSAVESSALAAVDGKNNKWITGNIPQKYRNEVTSSMTPLNFDKDTNTLYLQGNKSDNYKKLEIKLSDSSQIQYWTNYFKVNVDRNKQGSGHRF